MSDFAPADKRRAHCFHCQRDQRVETLFEKSIRWGDIGDVAGTDNYYVFLCRGCENVFFCKESSNSEEMDNYYDRETGQDVTHYPWTTEYLPRAEKAIAPRLPAFPLQFRHNHIFMLLQAVYKAIDSDLPVLAAMGARTTFDSASEILGVDPNLSFEDKLEKLRKDGHISGKEKGNLETLIDAGGAAAHRGWSPDAPQLRTLIIILNDFISRNLLLENDAKKLRDSIPPKQL